MKQKQLTALIGFLLTPAAFSNSIQDTTTFAWTLSDAMRHRGTSWLANDRQLCANIDNRVKAASNYEKLLRTIDNAEVASHDFQRLNVHKCLSKRTSSYRNQG